MLVQQNIASRQNFEVYTLVYNENWYNLTSKIVNTEYQLPKKLQHNPVIYSVDMVKLQKLKKHSVNLW